MKGKVLFSEHQTFRFTWSWWLIIVISLPLMSYLIYGSYQQLILNQTWGDKPMGDIGLALTTLFTGLLLCTVFLLFHFMKLSIEIDAGYIRYRFFPYQTNWQQLSKQDVKSIYVRQYSAISEYGGWGYRTGLGSGKALNVKGNWGLQLELTNGKKLLLGTQKPNEVKSALDELKKNWNY